MMAEERGRMVREALKTLRANDREVLALRFLEQLSTADAAAVLEITENTRILKVYRNPV